MVTFITAALGVIHGAQIGWRWSRGPGQFGEVKVALRVEKGNQIDETLGFRVLFLHFPRFSMQSKVEMDEPCYHQALQPRLV